MWTSWRDRAKAPRRVRLEGAPNATDGSLFPHLGQEALGMLVGLPGARDSTNVVAIFHEELITLQRQLLGAIARWPTCAERHRTDSWEAIRELVLEHGCAGEADSVEQYPDDRGCQRA